MFSPGPKSTSTPNADASSPRAFLIHLTLNLRHIE